MFRNLLRDNRELLMQIFRFVVVGCIATGIDFLFLYIFRELCHLPIILSNTLSFSISVIYNYWASMTFVFSVNGDKCSKEKFLLFVIFSVIGLFLNNFIVWLGSRIFSVYYFVSKVVSTVVVMIFNFITRKKFLEK